MLFTCLKQFTFLQCKHGWIAACASKFLMANFVSDDVLVILMSYLATRKFLML
jgi:hypothetical protein